MSCPQCGQADLVPRGGKDVCLVCGFVIGCCETDRPARA
jgi:hypothetical protein